MMKDQYKQDLNTFSRLFKKNWKKPEINKNNDKRDKEWKR